MMRTVDMIFDGEVLRPEQPLDLQPNGRYRVTIEPAAEPEEPGEWSLQDILGMACDLGVSDLAKQHNQCLYGLPKR
ncbi:MAG: antitoxin family protein [Acidobacteria bacterium]|jgi:hypothetical protein|nr:antitoxin family protein [Acidobacteriota bacterium]